MSKQYQDFLKSLSVEDFEKIEATADRYLKLIQRNNTSDTDFGNQLFSISLGVSLGLLEQYHEWLHLDLEK